MLLRTLLRFLIPTVALVTLAACTKTPIVLLTAASPTVSRPSPTSVSVERVTPTSVPTTDPSPTLATSPTTIPTATTIATATPASTPTAQPVASKFQLTAADSGKTFTYTITSRFGIVLNQTSYPRADLKVTCDPANTLGPISNVPSVPSPDYAVRYEGVTPGTCTLSDHDFVVHVQIVPMTPAAGASPTPTSTGQASQPTPSGTNVSGTPPYLDDRSSAKAVVESYYNAINRHEYDRAYSYWEPSAAQTQIPPYDQFKAGYADTTSVELTIGPVVGDVGAGQIYNAVPVALKATTTNGSSQEFVGCYTLHLGNPHIQDLPPFQPWQIQSAQIKSLPTGIDPTNALATICAANGHQGMPVSPVPTYAPTDISQNRYLDDRSTPEELLRSFFNAINSKEYDRAYSYWDQTAAGSTLPSYAQFKAGYAQTASVDLTLGQTTASPGAGQLYYKVPASLVSHQTDGQTQAFVGCYTLHLAQPAIQDKPPFQPMEIQAASVKQVANEATATASLDQVCQ